jgi:hypothetical protein
MLRHGLLSGEVVSPLRPSWADCVVWVVWCRYEEDRFVRLVTSKKDKKEKRKMQASGVLLNEVYLPAGSIVSLSAVHLCTPDDS